MSEQKKMCPYNAADCNAECARYVELTRMDAEGNAIKDDAGNPIKDGACADVWDVIISIGQKQRR